jgi:CRISPR/Cas system-associated endoribonuclease Cas2
MMTFEQVPLLRLSAIRALESGKISPEKFQKIMFEIEKIVEEKEKQNTVYQEAIKQLTKTHHLGIKV